MAPRQTSSSKISLASPPWRQGSRQRKEQPSSFAWCGVCQKAWRFHWQIARDQTKACKCGAKWPEEDLKKAAVISNVAANPGAKLPPRPTRHEGATQPTPEEETKRLVARLRELQNGGTSAAGLQLPPTEDFEVEQQQQNTELTNNEDPENTTAQLQVVFQTGLKQTHTKKNTLARVLNQEIRDKEASLEK